MASNPEVELRKLLQSSFTAEQLRDLVTGLEDLGSVAADIPWTTASLLKIAGEVVDGLVRHGAADAAFFELLMTKRPRKKVEIAAVAELFVRRDVGSKPLPPSQPTAAAEVPVAVPAVRAGPPVFAVPFDRKALTGRTSALAALNTAFTEPRRTTIGPAVAIVGVGGLGKTQLAIEYAYEARDAGRYPGGIYWITMDHELEPQLQVLSDAAGWAPLGAEPAYKIAEARRRLPGLEGALVILDNVEAFAKVEGLFSSGTRPHLLLTSIRPVPVPPLAVKLLLSREESLDLFVAESGRRLSQAERIAAEALLAQLGGWPLAIELTGAYLKYDTDTSVADYAALLEVHGLDAEVWDDAVLGGASATRHQTSLRATLRVDTRLLGEQPTLRAVLDVLAWSGPAAMGRSLLAAVLEQEEHQLAAALALGVRLQLLRTEGDHRYRIHRLLRDVLKEESTSTEASLHVRARRVADWFIARREDFRHLAEFEAEFDHLDAWQRSAEGRGWDWEETTLLWLQAYPSYHWGRDAEGESIVRGALGIYERAGLADTELEVRLCGDLSTLLGVQWKHQERQRWSERCERLLPSLPDSNVLDRIRVLTNLGTSALRNEDFLAGLALAQRARLAAAVLPLAHPVRLEAEDCFVHALVRSGRPKEAVTAARQLVQTGIEANGLEHPSVLTHQAGLAWALRQSGERRAGCDLLVDVTVRRRHLLPGDHLGAARMEADLADARRGLGRQLQEAGDRAGAAHEIRTALAHGREIFRLRAQVLPPDSEALTDAVETIAMCLWELGVVTGDSAHRREALAILNRALKVGDPDTKSYRSVQSLRRSYAREGIPGFHIPSAPSPERPTPTPTKRMPTPPPTSGPARIFLSYSHQDEPHRKTLGDALRVLERQELVTIWHDRQIQVGDAWRGQIDAHLESANLILFLVSRDFLASDYCWDVEMKRAMERHNDGTARVVPIFLRDCDWQGAPFSELQGVPDPRVPILGAPDVDAAWTAVARAVREVVSARGA
jgi:hypothetical protein